MNTEEDRIEWTRINNDSNGNPRYVCHYVHLLTKAELEYYSLNQSLVFRTSDNMTARYQIAAKRANKIGGRKFHNKQYGGGIVFQSYNIQETERHIKELLAKS